MQYFHAASGRHIGSGTEFAIGDVQYPANWLEHASVGEISALGLEPVAAAGARGDDRYYDNAEILSGTTLTITATPKDLGTVKAAAAINIDTAAGEARSRYITVAPGQDATYLLKAQRAAAFKAAAYAGPVPGLVQAEVDATGATAQQAADAILTQQELWEAKAAQIESARRRGKVAVGAASDLGACVAAIDAAIAELAAL